MGGRHKLVDLDVTLFDLVRENVCGTRACPEGSTPRAQPSALTTVIPMTASK
jgi:hypothetical protein